MTKQNEGNRTSKKKAEQKTQRRVKERSYLRGGENGVVTPNTPITRVLGYLDVTPSSRGKRGR